jgi:iron complex transport system substrate-binding protein
VTLTDSSGRKITVKSQPHRIVSLSPSITELLFYLGLSEKVVAVAGHCDYPPDALKKPKIGDVNLNIEKLLEFHPDLIVADNGLSDNLISRSDSMGATVLFLDSKDVDGIFNSIVLLGKATGENEVSHQLVNSLKEQVKDIREKFPPKKTKVFVEIWPDPLMTVGAKSFINDIITLAGGINIAGYMEKNDIQISSEWVVEKDPQVIIVSTPGTRDRVIFRTGWQEISAIREKHVYEIDPDIFVRPTPRIIMAIRQIALWLNQEEEF